MRVLIADDDRMTTAIVSSAMTGWGFDVDVAHDGAAAWQRLNVMEPPPIAIIDWTMPELSGLELCRRVRGTTRLSSLYLLLLTAHEGRADLIAGLDAGADDYMIKPVNLDELRARTHVGVRVASLQLRLSRQVTELRRAHDQLEAMASTDGLTQLYSRRWWFDLADTEFARTMRHARDVSVMVVDLDHFKRVNDQFGHEAGDDVLRAFAGLLRGSCRQTDLVGRIGGEEFALVLPETTPVAAQRLAARLTEGCRELIVPVGEQRIRFSCSIGLTAIRADDPDFATALRRADAALYTAKRAGRDRWTEAA